MSNDSNNGSNGSGSLPEDDSGMNIQQVIQMGELASQALNNPIYQLAHRIAVDQAILEWSSTSPKEVQKREGLWHEIQAHGRAAEAMRGCIERAQQLIKEQSDQQNTERDYLDRQGFGFEPGFGQTDTFQ